MAVLGCDDVRTTMPRVTEAAVHCVIKHKQDGQGCCCDYYDHLRLSAIVLIHSSI